MGIDSKLTVLRVYLLTSKMKASVRRRVISPCDPNSSAKLF